LRLIFTPYGVEDDEETRDDERQSADLRRHRRAQGRPGLRAVGFRGNTELLHLAASFTAAELWISKEGYLMRKTVSDAR
jgi:hypothetical protein